MIDIERAKRDPFYFFDEVLKDVPLEQYQHELLKAFPSLDGFDRMIISEGAYRYITLPTTQELTDIPDARKPSHRRTPLDRAVQGREARAAMIKRVRK